MTRILSKRSAILALALGALGALAPAPALAEQAPRSVTPASVEALSPQDREMLSLANDFARRCAEAIERWVASKEVSEEQLFSFLYYPMPNTDPPKFTTDWDRLSDRDILPIEESVLARSPAIIFTVMVDRHGYLPTHNQRYSLPLSGNMASDLVNNRTKRIFNDRTGLAAAQNEAAFLVQRYQRDTGETLVDLSVPLLVRGHHWGAVRIGYRPIDRQ
jgi:methyl-accepting chemotaxis protein